MEENNRNYSITTISPHYYKEDDKQTNHYEKEPNADETCYMGWHPGAPDKLLQLLKTHQVAT